ncbi:KAP family P-loop NTPase fold protein [Aeromonas salmonicida]|uniref:KAP family P-loop NTPase fold protein n=1 Tax=Aeromonas salmonicida TaxID=645 RepID=UPI0023303F3C|nr:P-loop NTPase fold protein [Aeromonas salmonicida]WCH25943.1 KAP family NTPase [Aeromonas salmonicida]
MSTSLIENAKYSSWKETHNFDNCKLNRKEYGQFLANYLIGEKDGFVLNLNGSWGTGKTEFLKRFYVELMVRGHPTIYIDAWESDFSQEPLTVVASELLNQLERLMDGAISDSVVVEVKRALGKALKGILVGLAGVASAKLLNDAAIGMEATNKLLEESPQNFTERLAKDYQSQLDAIQRVRKSLGELAEVLQTTYGTKLPVIVLIDELDRCRPTYAIEMLEVIKHFFSIKGFVFVIATDTVQLCHSIRSVYGDNFDSNQYLKRFFNRKASLEEPNIDDYVNTKSNNEDYIKYTDLELFPILSASSSHEEIIKRNIAMISTAYKLNIRDVDQLTDKLHSCLRTACEANKTTNDLQYINIVALIVGLIEQDFNLPSYTNRKNYNNTFTSPTNNYDLSPDINMERYIKLCMESVVLIQKQIASRYRETYQTIDELPNWEYYQGVRGEKPSNQLAYLSSSLSSSTNVYRDLGKKYWLWVDMKKIIELAGTIE